MGQIATPQTISSAFVSDLLSPGGLCDAGSHALRNHYVRGPSNFSFPSLSLHISPRRKCSQPTSKKGRNVGRVAGRQEGRQEGVIFNSAKLLRIESENTRHLGGLPHPPHLSSQSRRLRVECKRSLTRLQCDYEAGFTQCSPKNLPIAFKLA